MGGRPVSGQFRLSMKSGSSTCGQGGWPNAGAWEAGRWKIIIVDLLMKADCR